MTVPTGSPSSASGEVEYSPERETFPLDRLLSTWPIAAAFLTASVYNTLTRVHSTYLSQFGLGPSTFSHSIVDLASRDLFTLFMVLFFVVASLTLNRLIIGEWIYGKVDGAADLTTTWLTATPERRRVSLPIGMALLPVLTLGMVVVIADMAGRGSAGAVQDGFTEACRLCRYYYTAAGKPLAKGVLIDQDSTRIALVTKGGTKLIKLDDVGYVSLKPAQATKPIPTSKTKPTNNELKPRANVPASPAPSIKR